MATLTLWLTACSGSSAPPTPAISSFSATKTTITAGASTALTAVFANGSGTITPGVGAVQSGAPTDVTPAADTAYTLTVAGSGAAATSSLTVKVVPPPVLPVITVAAVVTAGAPDLTATVPAQAGCTYQWTVGTGVLTSGGTDASITFRAGPAGSQSLACTVTNVAGTSLTGSASLQVVAAPVLPIITVSPIVTAGASGLAASVPAQTGCAYLWTTGTGSLAAGSTGPSVTFTAGPEGNQSLTCMVVNAAGASLTGSATLQVVPAPALPVITVAGVVTATAPGLVASVPPQAGCTYHWGVGSGTLTAGDATPSILFTAGPAGSQALTCRVTNAAGTNLTGTANLQVVPAPVAAITALGYVTESASGLAASVANQPGCTYAWSVSGGALTAGGTTSTISYTAGGPGPLKLDCRVTNAAATTAAGSSTVQVVRAPSIGSFLAANSTIPVGGGTTLTYTFQDGTAVLNPGGLMPVSFGTTNVAPAVTTDYTLAVTNLAGTRASAKLTVTVDQTPFAITGFTGSSSLVTFGEPVTFNWTLQGLPVQLSLAGQSVLDCASTQRVPVRRQTFTLAGSNGAGLDEKSLTVAARGLDLLAGSLKGPGSLDGPGGRARFFFPRGITLDSAGGVYVADSYNKTVRKVDPDGTVTTVAGRAGRYGSQDGPAAQATFSFPYDLAREPATGALYVLDAADGLVRKILDGTVATVAGGYPAGSADGPGATARFNFPLGLAIDASGVLYVADSGNHTVRKIAQDGTVTTLAGLAGTSGTADGIAGAARFNTPSGLWVDAAGNVLVADRGNFTIRKITPTGVVTTIAGQPGLSGHDDGSRAQARFANPVRIASDGKGSLLVSDNDFGGLIRKVAPDGAVATLAGLPGTDAILDGPGSAGTIGYADGLAVDGQGRILVADAGGHAIRSIDSAGILSTLAGQWDDLTLVNATGAEARFIYPAGVAVNASGQVLVSLPQNGAIRRIDVQGKVSNWVGGFVTYGNEAGQVSAHRMAFGPDGTLYAVDVDHQTVVKILPDGTATILAGQTGMPGFKDGQGTDAMFKYPGGICVDNKGFIYVSDSANDIIRKISPQGLVTTFAGVPGAHGYQDGPGNLAQFYSPQGIAVDQDGNVLVGDNNSLIRKITPAGVVSTYAGHYANYSILDGPLATATFLPPTDLAFDAQGNLYVLDGSSHLVRKISTTGQVTTVAGKAYQGGTEPGPLPATLFNPSGLAVTAAGDLVLVSGNGVVVVTAP